MRLINHSPFAASFVPAWSRQGEELLVVIVKCAYVFEPDGRLATARDQQPVVPVDEFAKEQPLKMLRPADFNPGKPGTDVLLLGSAWAPRGEPLTSMPLSLAVGRLSVSARVTGERCSEWSLLGWRLTEPSPFLRLPLSWEVAFGGVDPEHPDKAFWPENPVGRGFRVGRPSSHEPVPAPCLEWADSPYRGIARTTRTLGLGPVHPAWAPRNQYAGTYDSAWREERAPFVPTDFDSRFHHLAPPYLRTAQPLQGGEVVAWAGFNPGLPASFHLPRASHQVVFRRQVQESCLDAVWLLPDDKTLVMTWRTVLPRRGGALMEVSVFGKALVPLGVAS